MAASDNPVGEAGQPLLLEAEAVRRAIGRLAREIGERNRRTEKLALLGIVRRGAALAARLAALLTEKQDRPVELGTLDISSYRDDGRAGGPEERRLLGRDIRFSLDGATVVLVDDVVHTGRTVRAALDALSDLGRPQAVQLAVLVDRGERELPIKPDYVGHNLTVEPRRKVQVRLREIDGFDGVAAIEAARSTPGRGTPADSSR